MEEQLFNNHTQRIGPASKCKAALTLPGGWEACGIVATSMEGGPVMGKHIVGSCVLSSDWICGLVIMVYFILFYFFQKFQISPVKRPESYFLPTCYEWMALCVNL